MSSSTDPKLESATAGKPNPDAHPTDDPASSSNEPNPTETKDAKSLATGSQKEPSSAEKPKPTYTELAASAATTATNAAMGVKDNVFSMFGGGVKKEKKEESKDVPQEASGSSKAQKEREKEKEAEAEADARGEVKKK